MTDSTEIDLMKNRQDTNHGTRQNTKTKEHLDKKKLKTSAGINYTYFTKKRQKVHGEILKISLLALTEGKLVVTFFVKSPIFWEKMTLRWMNGHT